MSYFLTAPPELDAAPARLLSSGRDNPKTAKGEARGYLTAILHLAPEKISGRNVCPHATSGCATACLNTAGLGGVALNEDGLNMVQVARIQRTRFFHRDRSAFMAQLVKEIASFEKRAQRKNLKPVVRLNGTSDLPWERFAIDGFPNVMAMFPSVGFYDYTKWPVRLRKPELAPGYHLTFSLAESNDDKARDALAAGFNVAVVFDCGKSEELPTEFWGFPVVNGDKTDLRFLDPSPCIVGLRAKGRAKKDRSGFVRKV